jgi:hypothetical protein
VWLNLPFDRYVVGRWISKLAAPTAMARRYSTCAPKRRIPQALCIVLTECHKACRRPGIRFRAAAIGVVEVICCETGVLVAGE